MPQIATFRLLFSCSPSPTAPLSASANLLKSTFASSLVRRSGRVAPRHRSYPTIFSSAPTSDWRGRRGGGFLPQRRRSSSTSGGNIVKEKRDDKGAPDMEQEGMGFNRKRAEGRDRSDRPRNLQLKNRKLNPVNTICYVQILGTGMDTQDTSPSVLLFFDKQRFIFNAGEGLQRFCTEHKIKLSKIDHMFLTRVCSETAGGLPGLLLTLAGIGEEGMSVKIWGPSDLKYLVDAMRSFIPNAAMVHTHSFGTTVDGSRTDLSNSEEIKLLDPIILIDDEVVRITAILLHPTYDKNCVDNMNDANVLKSTCSGLEQIDRLPESAMPSFQSSKGNGRSTLKPGDIAVVYACELPEIKGKFDPVKAEALGLKPGPKYRELQLGNCVKSDFLDIMVHPNDVLGPSILGPIVLLVDCPMAAHLPELLSIKSLNPYYTDFFDHTQEGSKFVNCIIHLGPASVTKTAEYQCWMKRFGGAQHIMAGHEIKNIEIPILRSSARITSRLNYLCPHLFPTPGFWSIEEFNSCLLESNASNEDSASVACESIPAENLLKFHLRPYSQLGLDRSVTPNLLTAKEIVNELLSEIPEIVEASKSISELWRGSGEANHMLTPTNDDMIEEPWMDANALMLDKNVRKQQKVTSEQIVVKHDSDIPSCLENIPREDMEIVLLGTGSSQPSKYRNVSSVYVNLFARGSLLLDCGEGTLAQLKRRFGVKGADDAVRALRFIWISHIHADHHTGLARVLALRCELLKGVPHEPVLVIGPRPLKRFLDAYSSLEDLDMQFLDCRYTTVASLGALTGSVESGESSASGYVDNKVSVSGGLDNTLFVKGSRMQSCWKRPGSPVDTATLVPMLLKLKQVLHEAGLESLFSIPVVHCPQAFGIVLTAAERINSVGKTIPGWKLVYSGDTRPCQALIDASRDATVLIHEATFEDGLEEEALARNHSTTMEAVNVGTSAGAYRIILTHFSQRYPKIPVFDEKHMQKTCIAFDMMSVNVADLPVLPKVLPYIKLLFRNEMMLDESEDVLVAAANQ
uniref:ribonuclease Z n=2 Tax=Anthurium amnicola TaxID=1678845 RepID=A0A1D1XFM1_9ARAE